MRVFGRRLAVLLLISLAAMTFSSCSTFTRTVSRARALPKGATIGVVVDGTSNVQPMLDTFLVASLMDYGLVPKALNLRETILDIENMQKPSAYSFGESLAQGVARSGKVSGNVDTLEKLLTVNDAADTATRYDIESSLVKRVVASWGVDYLLLVRSRGLYSYEARVLDLKTRAIVFTYFADASPQGWETNMPLLRPSKYEGVIQFGSTGDGEAGSKTERVMIEFSLNLANALTM